MPRFPALLAIALSSVSTSAQNDEMALVWRWAPLLRQQIVAASGHGLGGRADLLAAVDFDGDWDPTNNWENAEGAEFRAVVYGSVVSSASHHFLLYLFYHPRDWTNHWFSPRWRDSEHENDLEAAVLMLRRAENGPDRLEAALVVYHGEFRPLLPRGSRLRSRGDAQILRSFTAEGVPRPVLEQEARGHALRAWSGDPLLGPGWLLYRPLREPAEAASIERGLAAYELRSVFEPGGLFARRDDRALFTAAGRLRGDCEGGAGSGLRSCVEDKASAPWAMHDGRVESGPAGALARDPARVFAAYFEIPAPFVREYESNPYRTR